MIVAIYMLAIVYCGFLWICRHHWRRIPDKSSIPLQQQATAVAVIVASRNEEHNIQKLLHALADQDYPIEKFEVIISDDHSTDQTVVVAREFFRNNNLSNFKIQSSHGHSKREAITEAIGSTVAELIILTDADSVMGTSWISSIVNEYVSSDAAMICGPVSMHNAVGLLERLQAAEFAGLIGIGAAGIQSKMPMMCNGANMTFRKSDFLNVGGYSDARMQSGDDTQLLLKFFRAYEVVFLKDRRAIVGTQTQPGLLQWWQQRHRWASKIPTTLTRYTVIVAFCAWLFHLLLLMQLIISLFGEGIMTLLLPVAMKIVSEIIFLNEMKSFLGIRINPLMIVLIQPLYWAYISVVGIISPFAKYSWKGRQLR